MIQDKDYVMRLVHETVRMLIRLLFGQDIDNDKGNTVSPELILQYKKLIDMIDRGEINEAENLLIDGMKADNKNYFEMALLFYEKLASKKEEFLSEHNYTKAEIVDGLKYVVDFYGYAELWNVCEGDL